MERAVEAASSNGMEEALARFLLGDARALDPQRLSELGLAPYASASAVPDPSGELRAALVAATARHAANRSVLARLLAAWHGEGIEVLLLKGFALAEFTYSDPGARHYSDIDLLLRSDRLEAASQAAQRLGWQEIWRSGGESGIHALRSSHYRGHEVMLLKHQKLGIQIDVHRRLAHNNHNRLPFAQAQARITDLAWAAAQPAQVAGVQVRLLSPADAILIGIVVNRAWSSDEWQLRPHDYLDFKLLIERHGIQREQLESRARELGCSRTFERFLDRCNPYTRTLDLRPLSASQRHSLEVALVPDRGFRGLERTAMAAVEYARGALELARVLPQVAHIVRLFRRLGSVESARHELTQRSRPVRELSHDEWMEVKRAVRRSFRVLRIDSAAHPELLALSLYAVLQRRGCQASLRLPEITDRNPQKPVLEVAGRALDLRGTTLGR